MASSAGRVSTRGCSSSISDGATIPGMNAAAAASPARRTSVPAGREGTKETAKSIERTPDAAMIKTIVDAAATQSAAGRVAIRRTRNAMTNERSSARAARRLARSAPTTPANRSFRRSFRRGSSTGFSGDDDGSAARGRRPNSHGRGSP